MNIKKIKMWLTSELINNSRNENILAFIRQIMRDVKEAGKFLGLTKTDSAILNPRFEHQQYVLQYENMTLDLNLMYNNRTRQTTLNGFNIR